MFRFRAVKNIIPVTEGHNVTIRDDAKYIPTVTICANES